ncbi:biotin/lipoate--protein ligase family protein [uncultured Roseobacter sp.]|uniref:biotin/lipoate--protein ligase family protein n=1 Tax=uncultured Roseobacter sp. TaxID=114847 RepID=UPI002622EDD2|nr:biotin/lipoate--protein ligase family protein [uncultured Roseobacter sp.]
MKAPQLPPLFSALATAGADPYSAACAEARGGCDAGLVTYDIAASQLRAAVVFAPEVPLREAMIMLPLCAVGFQNAFGALAPPEVSLQLEWTGALRLNGARCGALTVSAVPDDPDTIPDWMVVALTLTLWSEEEETGATPDITALSAEGCGDVAPVDLLEAWIRHTLVWINRWTEDGVKPLHDEWTGLAHGIGEKIAHAGMSGVFRGIDEEFGLLLQRADTAQIIPLTQILKDPP